MAGSEPLTVSLDTAPASDSWGFVGRVMIGEHEAYRTLAAFPTPTEAEQAVREILAGVLGPLLAGEEWRRVQQSAGHTPLRRDLMLGLRRQAGDPVTDAPKIDSPAD